jgi:hypothetical protein
VFVSAVYEIGSVRRAGASEHLGKVLCHRVPAYVEFLTDLNIRQPASNKLEDRTLTPCEICEPSVVACGRTARQASHKATLRPLLIPFLPRSGAGISVHRYSPLGQDRYCYICLNCQKPSF